MRWLLLRFLLVLGIIGLLAWGLSHSYGHVRLDWFGWRLDTHPAIVLLILMLVAGIGLWLVKLWLKLISLPSLWQAMRHRRRQEKLGQVWQTSLAAFISRDSKSLLTQAKLIESLGDKSQQPYSRWLQAQAYATQGQIEKSWPLWSSLLTETDDLVIKEIVLASLIKIEEEGRVLSPELKEQARHASHQLKEGNPNSLIAAVFDYADYYQQGAWGEAYRVAQNLVEWEQARYHGLSVETRELLKKSHAKTLSILLTEQAGQEKENQGNLAHCRQLYEQALKLWAANQRAAIALANLIEEQGETKAAKRVIADIWRVDPSAILGEVYLHYHESLKKETGAESPTEIMARLPILTNHNPEHRESHYLLLKQAIKANLIGEAKKQLSQCLPTGFPVAEVLSPQERESSFYRKLGRDYQLEGRQCQAIGDVVLLNGLQENGFHWYRLGLEKCLVSLHQPSYPQPDKQIVKL